MKKTTILIIAIFFYSLSNYSQVKIIPIETVWPGPLLNNVRLKGVVSVKIEVTLNNKLRNCEDFSVGVWGYKIVPPNFGFAKPDRVGEVRYSTYANSNVQKNIDALFEEKKVGRKYIYTTKKVIKIPQNEDWYDQFKVKTRIGKNYFCNENGRQYPEIEDSDLFYRYDNTGRSTAQPIKANVSFYGIEGKGTDESRYNAERNICSSSFENKPPVRTVVFRNPAQFDKIKAGNVLCVFPMPSLPNKYFIKILNVSPHDDTKREIYTDFHYSVRIKVLDPIDCNNIILPNTPKPPTTPSTPKEMNSDLTFDAKSISITGTNVCGNVRCPRNLKEAIDDSFHYILKSNSDIQIKPLVDNIGEKISSTATLKFYISANKTFESRNDIELKKIDIARIRPKSAQQFTISRFTWNQILGTGVLQEGRNGFILMRISNVKNEGDTKNNTLAVPIHMGRQSGFKLLSNSKLNQEYINPFWFEVYSLTGKIILKKQIFREQEGDFILQGLPSNVYIIKSKTKTYKIYNK